MLTTNGGLPFYPSLVRLIPLDTETFADSQTVTRWWLDVAKCSVMFANGVKCTRIRINRSKGGMFVKYCCDKLLNRAMEKYCTSWVASSITSNTGTRMQGYVNLHLREGVFPQSPYS